MKTTFKDKILGFYRRTIYKHSWLKGPMVVFLVVMLFFDRIAKNIRMNCRRILGVAFTFTFAFISCSFSGVLWGNDDYNFTDTDLVIESEIEESNAALASEDFFDENSIVEDDEVDIENNEELFDEEAISGADILENIDLDSIETNEDEDFEEFNRDDWKLVLINKQHPIPDNYSFTLGSIMRGMQCDERVVSDLYLMIEAAYSDGVNLVVSSPYRASSRQNMLFEKKINNYTNQGMSYMEAYRLAAQAVTVPGCSEHEVGLAFDITCDTYSNLNAGFGDTVAGKWLKEHSAEYGFVVRYPLGKEDITGIEYEPWHFRYVGKNAATIMNEENITLEEFWEKYL